MKTLKLQQLLLFIAATIFLPSTLSANDSLQAPAYLQARVLVNDVELSWGGSGPQGNWLTYDNGVPAEAIGLSQPGTFRIAARWPSSALTAYINKPVTWFAFYPNSYLTDYTFKIWTGSNADTLVYSQTLHGLNIGEWNEVLLSSPMLLEAGTEYWFGIEFDQYTELEGPAVMDSGPATAGSGDMLNLGGNWVSMQSIYNYDNNWVLRVFVSNDGEPEMIAKLGEPEIPLMSSEAILANTGDFLKASGAKMSSLNAVLLGFNLYRNNILLNESPMNEAFYLDTSVASGTYTYSATAVYDTGESDTVSTIVQIGGPVLMLSPESVSDTLQGGEILTIDLTLTNNGQEVLEWEANELPYWISLSSASGTLSPNDTTIVQLTVNTPGLLNGLSSFVIEFETNNLNNPSTFLPVNIMIDGQLMLASNPPLPDFGTQAVFQTVLFNIELINMSDALLMILSGETGTGNFDAYMPTWAIPVGESITVPVSFTPDAAGNFLDTLKVQHFGYWGSETLNIPLRGEGMILTPSNLTATLDENIVTLEWLPPGASPNELRFGSGEPFSAVGTSEGIYEVAARFKPADLMPYSSKQLDQVGFYLADINAEFTLKVYTGEFADVNLISLPVSNPVAGTWNDIALPAPLPLAGVDYLWLGYEMNLSGVEFNAGVDGGPVVTGSGDLIRINGSEWTTLTSYGISYNWNIRGLVSDPDASTNLILKSGNELDGPENSDLTGYNVYRDGVLLTPAPIVELSFSDEIEPGIAYEYGITALFTYGESNPALIVLENQATLSLPAGWEFISTPVAHNIHIPDELLQSGMNLSPGDMLGVFYNDAGTEKCAGAMQWDGTHQVLTAYGNDPATSAKDGFYLNETLTWKIYMQQTGATANIVATYNHNMPHYDGSFKMLGLSMLESIEPGTVGVDDVFARTSEINIYPNPSNGQITLSGLSSGDQVNVYDKSGRLILSRISERPYMQLNISQRGLYMVEIRGQQVVERKKLIIL